MTTKLCEECGNDDPADGFRVCLDCLEETHPDSDPIRALPIASDALAYPDH